MHTAISYIQEICGTYPNILMIHLRQVIFVSGYMPGSPGTVDKPPASIYVDYCPRVAESLAIHSHAWPISGPLGVAEDNLTMQSSITEETMISVGKLDSYRFSKDTVCFCILMYYM